MSDLVVKLLITADGKQSVQEINLTRDEIDKLGGAQKETARGGDELGAVSTRLGTALKLVGGTAVAVGTAMGVAYAAMRPFAEAQAEAEQSSARLNAVLRATGHSAGLSAGQINALADSLAATTQFDDEAIRNASAVMATFRNVQGDTFKEGISLATDLSALLGTDLQSAVLQVGKALNEPEQGITALSRAGIQFSEVQKQQIKHFVETNELGKAQAIVLAEMKNQFGGTAQAMNTGITKATNDLKKAWNELYEDIGAVVGPLFTSMTEGATAAANAMRTLLAAMQGKAENTQGGTWLETQTARINAMADQIEQTQQDLLRRRDNPLLVWLPTEQEAQARIEALKTSILAETNHLNTLLADAGGRPKTKDDEARDAGERAAAKARAEKEAASLATTRDQTRKRDDLGIDTGKGDAGPQANVIQLAEARQRLRNDAELQTFREGAAAKLAALDTALQTEDERIDAEYQQRADDAALSYSAGLITLQGYKDRETQAWAAAEAKKTAIAQEQAAKRKAQDDQEFKWKIQAAQNVASVLGSLASLAEGRGREEFKRAQRLARAQTIVNTAAMAIAAGRDTPGPWWVRAAAVAAAVATGVAQLNKINETQYSGGGSIAAATGGGAGGAVPGTDSASTGGGGDQFSTGTPRSGAVTQISVVGNDNTSFSAAQVRAMLAQIKEAVARGDEIILTPDSYNTQLILQQAAA